MITYGMKNSVVMVVVPSNRASKRGDLNYELDNMICKLHCRSKFRKKKYFDLSKCYWL